MFDLIDMLFDPVYTDFMDSLGFVWGIDWAELRSLQTYSEEKLREVKLKLKRHMAIYMGIKG